MHPTAKRDPEKRWPHISRYSCDLFNFHLRKQVERFKNANPDSRVTLIPTEDIFLHALLYPNEYGATNTTCMDKGGNVCVSSTRIFQHGNGLTFGNSCGGMPPIRQRPFKKLSPRGLRGLHGGMTTIISFNSMKGPLDMGLMYNTNRMLCFTSHAATTRHLQPPTRFQDVDGFQPSVHRTTIKRALVEMASSISLLMSAMNRAPGGRIPEILAEEEIHLQEQSQ